MGRKTGKHIVRILAMKKARNHLLGRRLKDKPRLLQSHSMANKGFVKQT